jgi:hypothetical protein
VENELVFGPFCLFLKIFLSLHLYYEVVGDEGVGKRRPTVKVLGKRERGNDHCQSVGKRINRRNNKNNNYNKGRRRAWELTGWWECAQVVIATMCCPSLSPPPLPTTPLQQSKKSYSNYHVTFVNAMGLNPSNNPGNVIQYPLIFTHQ